MQYIADMKEGDKVNSVYLVKEKHMAQTRAGKPYENLVLQDRTGTIQAKIWEPSSPAIFEFEQMDFIDCVGDVTSFNNTLQLHIRSARQAREGDYDPADYLPTTEKNVDTMYNALLAYIDSVQNVWLHSLLTAFFVDDQAFVSAFRGHSAAKSVHHSFAGGLLEHTLSVTNLCAYFAKAYPMLDRDLLLTAAICHDIGKTKELSDFPQNDYTDEGQLLGHIVIGTEMISEKIREIPDFPPSLAFQLKHCILAHHGAYEYGSPKLPATLEALAVSLADNADAKMQIMKEQLLDKGCADKNGWTGYNRFFESNLRRTDVQDGEKK